MQSEIIFLIIYKTVALLLSIKDVGAHAEIRENVEGEKNLYVSTPI